MKKVRVGIAGYGNIGRGVEAALASSPDMELAGIFTRRGPGEVASASGAAVYSLDKACDFTGSIDVMVLCGGSFSDLPVQGPQLAAMFNTVDSFDTHSKMREYFAAVDAAAKTGGKTAVIGAGWDPGLFSMVRVLFDSLFPDGATNSFWGTYGRGLSQGHSDAVRRVPGVKLAAQYTVPDKSLIELSRSGKAGALTARQTHRRRVFCVLEPGADAAAVKTAVVTMLGYFEGYETEVNFISEEEYLRSHTEMSTGGASIRAAATKSASHLMEFSLNMDSNPEFTASVMVAYARATHRLACEGAVGARTVLDVAPAYLSPLGRDELLEKYV